MVIQPGEMIGQYRVESQVGSGGMATVYKAYHAKLDRNVAIKMMHQTLTSDEAFHSRFEREARIVARLEHPNIVPIFDFNEHNSDPYLVMKYVEGRTLKSLLKQGPLPLNEVRRIMTAVAGALDYAHKQGVLHRDVKPSNIILDENGTPFLTDFGLARIALSGESTMSVDTMLGTPHYISPEQARGDKNLDSRTDIYSLGVILYELIVGRVPFSGDTAYATVHDHIYTPPPMPSYINPDISPEIEAVLLKALSKDPAERYATAGDLLKAFERAAAGVDDLERGEAQPNHSTFQQRPVYLPPAPKPPKIPAPPLAEKSPSVVGKIVSTVGVEIKQALEKEMDKSDDSGVRKFRQKLGEWGVLSPVDAVKTEEELIRERVKKRIEERNGLMTHIAIYLVINLMMIFAFGFPFWMIFVVGGWGIGVVAHIFDYYNKYGGGRERMEAEIQRQIELERSRAYEIKRKNDDYTGIRLTEDGELTDSYAEENFDLQDKRKRRS